MYERGMKENVSGCFFLNTVYIELNWTEHALWKHIFERCPSRTCFPQRVGPMLNLRWRACCAWVVTMSVQCSAGETIDIMTINDVYEWDATCALHDAGGEVETSWTYIEREENSTSDHIPVPCRLAIQLQGTFTTTVRNFCL